MRQAALTAGADSYISTVDAPDVVVCALQSCLEPETPVVTHDPCLGS